MRLVVATSLWLLVVSGVFFSSDGTRSGFSVLRIFVFVASLLVSSVSAHSLSSLGVLGVARSALTVSLSLTSAVSLDSLLGFRGPSLHSLFSSSLVFLILSSKFLGLVRSSSSLVRLGLVWNLSSHLVASVHGSSSLCVSLTSLRLVVATSTSSWRSGISSLILTSVLASLRS